MSSSILDQLPKEAGGVILDFSPVHHTPRRVAGEKPKIILPLISGMKYHSLKEGEQFLLIYGDFRDERKNLFRPLAPFRGAFFGGMDESAFITGIGLEPAKAFDRGGEKAFFDELVPYVIKSLRCRFLEGAIRRQGDIWSFQLPATWDELIEANTMLVERKGITRKLWKKRASLQRKQIRKFEILDRTRVRNVLETNHQLEGFLITTHLKINDFRMQNCVLAEGTLSAPDHAPQELAGGPHVLVRTPHIISAINSRLLWD